MGGGEGEGRRGGETHHKARRCEADCGFRGSTPGGCKVAVGWQRHLSQIFLRPQSAAAADLKERPRCSLCV